MQVPSEQGKVFREWEISSFIQTTYQLEDVILLYNSFTAFDTFSTETNDKYICKSGDRLFL